MKIFLFVILMLLFALYSCGVKQKMNEEQTKLPNKESKVDKVALENLYVEAMDFYDKKDFKQASEKLDLFLKKAAREITLDENYNAACIYALNNENKKSLDLLAYVVYENFFSNIDHIKSDSDLFGLHMEERWKGILQKVKENRATQPKRTRQLIKNELFKAKEILDLDNGNLWGENLWDTKILVIDYDRTIYSLENLEGSKTKDSILYYTSFDENELSFTNTMQKFRGVEYATVMIDAVDDKSSTIIHELFHLTHLKDKTLRANPIVYLDKYDARVLLRLEYQALKNALNKIDTKGTQEDILTYINDAFLFRKLRQDKYKGSLEEELELETVEGLANYTGVFLSSIKNKYQKAIDEINEREMAETYTRPFPYATGPAYGCLFDYLHVEWRQGLNKIYNFLEIYETEYLKEEIVLNKESIQKSKTRNNFKLIDKEELNRKIAHEKNIQHYTDILMTRPTIKVNLVDQEYSRTYNMNGTLVLEDIGVVYSGIKGIDLSGANFGNFEIIPGRDVLGDGGVLEINKEPMVFVFPKHIKIEGNKIIGEAYEIELNEGWKLITVNVKGDMEIVKKN